MKKSILFLLITILACSLSVQAAIKTVSNNPGSPGQYTNLQTAIDAAGFNDTILVAGSTASYGSISFGKPLVMIGAGYNNPNGSNTTIESLTLTRQTYYISASGTKLMGFIVNNSLNFNGDFTGGTALTRTIDNVVIERCRLKGVINIGVNGCQVQSFHNDTIRNCLIENNVTYSDPCSNYNYVKEYTNIFFHNNIFNGSKFIMGYEQYGTIYMADLKSFYLRNNIFLTQISKILNFTKNMIIENNIFYGAEPQGGTGCVFTKNLTYMCLNNTIPGTGNLGSGNMVNQNPLFVSVPPQGGFSYSYDYHLQAGSPGKNAGTDGTDIGIYGGMMPFEVGANPYIPQMMETTLPSGSSVPAGGTLNLHFKARKQN